MKNKTIEEQQRDNLKRLIKHFDYDRFKLANALGVPLNTVYGWVFRGRISAKMSIKAEKITGGKITKKMLRPDISDWIDE